MIIDFPIIKINNPSLSHRSLISGAGINDASYQVCPTVDGKRLVCPYYNRWIGMLDRCYSDKYQKKRPTYIGCTVVDEWLTFSNFRKWMDLQGWEEMELDKDILVPGNKVYGPDTCAFVPQRINLLLHEASPKGGGLPTGVSYRKDTGKFRARAWHTGKGSSLGQFNTPEAAQAAYKAEKNNILRAIAVDHNETISIYVRLGLLKRAA